MARAVLENAGELRPLRCTGAQVTEVEPGGLDRRLVRTGRAGVTRGGYANLLQKWRDVLSDRAAAPGEPPPVVLRWR